jgi:hypothetical protein
MRVLGAQIPETLRPALFEVADKLEQVDRALLVVTLAYGFHGGYSVAISDLTDKEPKNLHLSYMNEQRSIAAASATKSGG